MNARPLVRFVPCWLICLFLTAFSTQAAEPTNAPVSADYSSFRIIPDRNIFNSRRYGRATTQSRRDSRPAARVESFALLGTMSYSKGDFAFFEGSRSDYQKVLQPSEAIAGYTVTEIAPSHVKLSSGTNEVQLRVGMQLRREDNGEWQLSERVEAPEPPRLPPVAAQPVAPPAEGSQNTNEQPPIIIVNGDALPFGDGPPPGLGEAIAAPPVDAPPPGDSPVVDDVLRRLMERRRQEENP